MTYRTSSPTVKCEKCEERLTDFEAYENHMAHMHGSSPSEESVVDWTLITDEDIITKDGNKYRVGGESINWSPNFDKEAREFLESKYQKDKIDILSKKKISEAKKFVKALEFDTNKHYDNLIDKIEGKGEDSYNELFPNEKQVFPQNKMPSKKWFSHQKDEAGVTDVIEDQGYFDDPNAVMGSQTKKFSKGKYHIDDPVAKEQFSTSFYGDYLGESIANEDSDMDHDQDSDFKYHGWEDDPSEIEPTVRCGICGATMLKSDYADKKLAGESAYWGRTGNYQDLYNRYSSEIPEEGHVNDHLLEQLRVVSNVYYDVGNNGGMNLVDDDLNFVALKNSFSVPNTQRLVNAHQAMEDNPDTSRYDLSYDKEQELINLAHLELDDIIDRLLSDIEASRIVTFGDGLESKATEVDGYTVLDKDGDETPTWYESDNLSDAKTYADKIGGSVIEVPSFGGVIDKEVGNIVYRSGEAKANEYEEDEYDEETGELLTPSGYDEDEWIDDSDVPKSGHYESWTLTNKHGVDYELDDEDDDLYRDLYSEQIDEGDEQEVFELLDKYKENYPYASGQDMENEIERTIGWVSDDRDIQTLVLQWQDSRYS